jgi:hypothetical protein
VIYSGAPTPLLRSAGLRLSVASSLDGVMDVAVVADLVVAELSHLMPSQEYLFSIRHKVPKREH